MKRFLLRLSPNSVNALEKYKMAFDLKNKRISYNTLINLLIFFKVPDIDISNKDINYFNGYKRKLKRLHSSNYYQKYIKNVVELTNSVNRFNRKFSGAFNNVNQIAKFVNSDNKVSANELSEVRYDLILALRDCLKFQKEVLKLWR